MRAITAIFIIFLFGCSKDCPECYNFAEQFRLAILNTEGKNLLDTNRIDGVIINLLTLNSGQSLNYQIKDFIIQSNPVGFWLLETIDEDFFNNCINQEGEFYLTYKNSSVIDTINILIEKVVTTSEDGCKCVGYPYRYVKHNRVLITEYESEHTGSAIIRK